MFELPLVIDEPGALLAGIEVRGAENSPEMLYQLSKILRERRLSIRALISGNLSDDKVDVYVCVRLPSGDFDKNGVVEELRRSIRAESIIWVDYEIEGFAVSTFFPLKVFGRRAVIFSAPVLGSMIKGYRKRLGVSAANVIMYYAGYSGGLDRGREAVGERGELSPRELFLRFLYSGKAFGQYDAELKKMDEKTGETVVVVRNSWESEYIGGGYDEPQCHYLRGFFQGFIESLFNREMESREIQCICKGDTHCEFHITPKTL